MVRRVLFVASEVYPLVKTGGLADVAASLPAALNGLGLDCRLLLPAYQSILAGDPAIDDRCRVTLEGEAVELLETRLPGSDVPVWLIHHPLFSERPGNPYHDQAGVSWPDNAERFMLLCRVASALCAGAIEHWRPQVLHCNDWQTGPAVALVKLQGSGQRCVFTIHSLAHMGLFDRATFDRIGLPQELWHSDAMEFYGQLSFIKGGLVYADKLVAVSPGYAREICSAPAGLGLEGLLSHRRDNLTGIVNGIDTETWNPARDPYIKYPYDADSLDHKARNRRGLQRALGLRQFRTRPLLGSIGRLVEQKGIELLLGAVEEILALPAQLVVLGSGDAGYEARLRELAAKHPGSLAVVIGYDETLAHRIEAASDIFLMPSLFEPCGLNQLYSLRYGTLPVVRAVGGLADTVTDTDPDSLADGTANGFSFDDNSPQALLAAVQRAVTHWQDEGVREVLQQRGMRADSSWQKSASAYLQLYGSEES